MSVAFSTGDVLEVRALRGYDRLLKAADVLHERGGAEAITTKNLARLSGISQTDTNEIILDEKGRVDGRLRPPPIHYLRQAVDAYDGNLEEAQYIWQKFKPTRRDWIRSVKLPKNLGKKESRLLGVLWADGYLDMEKKRTVVYGQESDRRFFTEWVAPAVAKIHNLPVEVYMAHPRTEFGVYDQPQVNMNSGAITTWLADDLHFSSRRNGSRVTPRGADLHTLGFVEGAIAGAGSMQEGRMRVSIKDGKFVKGLHALAQEIGLSATEPKRTTTWRVEPQWFMDFSNRDIDTVELLNPKHLSGGKEPVALRRPEAYQKAVATA